MSLSSVFGAYTTAQAVTDQYAGHLRREIPKSVFDNTMADIEALARVGDDDARMTKKLLERLEYYKGKI